MIFELLEKKTFETTFCDHTTTPTKQSTNNMTTSNSGAHVLAQVLDQQLLKSAMDGQERKVAELLKKGANVNCKDDDGYSPLMNACSTGQYKTILNKFGKTAKQIAQSANSNDCIKFL